MGPMNDRTLDRLFRRFRDKNDGTALAAVFDSTARELLDVAGHLIGEPAAAEDLVQETFLAAIRGARRYDSSRPVKAWLYGILWREAQRARRDAARVVEPDRLPERRNPGPHEQLLAREVPEAVERALEDLPRRYREVLAPLVREGRAPEEIARELQRAPGTVRSQIHRGLERLRRALPRGLAGTPGFLFLPAGSSVRGLEVLRGELLRSAGFSPAVAAAAPALSLQISLGVLLMSKTTILAGAALLAGVSFWSLRDSFRTPEPGRVEDAAPVESNERAERGPLANLPRHESATNGSERKIADGQPAVTPPESAEEIAVDPLAHWLARFAEDPESWRHGWNVAAKIAELPPDEALAIMTGVWPHLSVPVKEQALKPFVFGEGHEHALPLLHLAATDPSLSVQGRALGYLKEYAFRDFSTDYDAYLDWARTWSGRPLEEVLMKNAQRFAGELRSLPPEELLARLRSVDGIDLDAGNPYDLDLVAVIREAGGLVGLSTCVQYGTPEAAREALEWSKTLQADEAWLRTYALPALQSPGSTDPGVLDASIDALGRPDCGWAREPLLAHLRYLATPLPVGVESADSLSPGLAFETASALAEIGDPAAIPAMIQILANDASGRLDYAIGHFGLAKLTGVSWQESYDAEWWLDWWKKNKSRLPAEIGGTVINRDGR